MIRHIVLVRFDAGTPDSERHAIFADLQTLVSLVPGMKGLESGANVSPEGLAQGFTHAFTADFDDVAARDAYLIHPAHQAAGGRLVKAAAGGLEGLAVIDIAIA